MARKKDTTQKAALREMMGNYLKENNVKVKDGTDVNSIMQDMMSIILEGALDQEMDEELGYSQNPRLFLTCPDNPVIYKMRVEISETSFQPQSLS